MKLKYYPKNNKYNDTIFYLYNPEGILTSHWTERNHINQDTSWNYSEDGILIQELVYDSGKLNGMSYTYARSGALYAVGKYKNNLETGDWIYYDSLHPGKALGITGYFIIHNKSIRNKFLVYDSLGNIKPTPGRYYHIIPCITRIADADTVYSFTIRIFCHYEWVDQVRVIYGKLGNDFSDFSKADTIYPENGILQIPNIDHINIPDLRGIVQFYTRVYSTKINDTVTRIVDSYFNFNPHDSL